MNQMSVLQTWFLNCFLFVLQLPVWNLWLIQVHWQLKIELWYCRVSACSVCLSHGIHCSILGWSLTKPINSLCAKDGCLNYISGMISRLSQVVRQSWSLLRISLPSWRSLSVGVGCINCDIDDHCSPLALHQKRL
jgi:hypothetical protein